MNIDYLTSNANNKYPFKDNATLKSVEGSYLSNDTFLDVIAVCKLAPMVGAYLSSIVVDHTEETATLTFQFFDSAGADYQTFEMVIPFVNIIEKEFYGVSTDEASVKVVFGPQMVTWKEQVDDVVLSFIKANATLEQSAVIAYVPEVTSIAFINWDKDTNEASSSALLTIQSEEDVTIEARANTFIASANGAAIDIISGQGSGLYDGCSSSDSVIRTINSTGPDSYHNFLFTTDDCYVIADEENGITIDNHCTPKCTAEQIQGYAYYLNRVNDGMTWVQDYAVELASTLSAEVDDFVTNTLPTWNVPYYKVKFEKLPTVDVDRFYYSFCVGFFNPSSTAKLLTLTISSTGDIVTASRRYRIDSATTLMSSNILTTVSVPCLKTLFLEFVVSAIPTKTATLSGTFGVLAVNSTSSLT